MKKLHKARVYTSDAMKRFVSRSNPVRKKRTEQQIMLADMIHEGMIAKGWNQKKFAEKMGKLPSEICKWLSGTHNFTVDTLFEISDILGIQLINLATAKPKPAFKPLNLILMQSKTKFTSFEISDLGQIKPEKNSKTKMTYGC